RIQPGGGCLPSGALNKAGLRSTDFAARSSKAAAMNPISGDITSALTVSATLVQLTPSPKALSGLNRGFIRPTPTMDPISAWELERGGPRSKVPTFQKSAESKNEKTFATPGPEPTLRASSTGKRAPMRNATVPEEVNTPIRFQQPDQTTACDGFRVLV